MYLIWLLIFICIPTLIIWLLNFNLLWKYKKTLGHVIFFALVFSIPWDIYAVKTNIWMFPDEGNIGLNIGLLPIEEYLFMAFVSLLIGSIAIVLKYKLRRD